MAVLDSVPLERQDPPMNGGEKKPPDAASGLSLPTRQMPLYSGSIHYWRHAPETWPLLLERITGLGFNIVQTPIPWGVHEVSYGVYDFGDKTPQKDLPKFLDLCQKAGVSVILRAGPCIDEELPHGGFPLRVTRNPALWALTSTGAPAVSNRTHPPFVIPSYACEKFYTEVAKYFDAVAPIIKPRQSPKGPIVLCSVNKETAFYGRRKGDDLDYSTDSIALYGKFLAEKYTSVEKLSGIYGKKIVAFSEILPPRIFDTTELKDIPSYLDWMEYKEYLIRYALQRFAKMLRERDLSLPLGVDGPSDISAPVDTYRLQTIPEISLHGLEVDPARQKYPSIARSVRYLAGTRKLAWVSSFGCGTSWMHPYIPTPAEEEFAILAAIMHGMSAVNFHILVEGDRWVGAPITREGTYREEYADVFRRLAKFLTQSQVWESKKAARALVLIPFTLERYHRSCSTLNQAYLGLLRVPAVFSEVHDTPGFETEPAHQSVLEKNNWVSEIFRLLEQAQTEYNISDTHAPLEELKKYSMVFLPTSDFMDTQEQEKLLAFIQAGGHLVIGPGLPTKDASLLPASVLANQIREPGIQTFGSGKIMLIPQLDAESFKSILRPEMANPIVPINEKLRVTIREGNSTLVFVANPTEETQTSMLVSPRPLRGLWNAPEAIQSIPISIELKPFTIQVWEVVK